MAAATAAFTHMHMHARRGMRQGWYGWPPARPPARTHMHARRVGGGKGGKPRVSMHIRMRVARFTVLERRRAEIKSVGHT